MKRPWPIAGVACLALLGSMGHLEAQPAPKNPAPAKTASEIEQIKETQKLILERLDAQDKLLKEILQKVQAGPAQARPQIDPNKVYSIPITAAAAVKGPKNASVTLVEFSDYQ